MVKREERQLLPFLLCEREVLLGGAACPSSFFRVVSTVSGLFSGPRPCCAMAAVMFGLSFKSNQFKN